MRRALLLACAALGVAAGLEAQVVTARVGSELGAANYYTPVTVPITVDMNASGGASLGSYTARLTWNPNALVYNSYVSGGAQDSSAQGNFPPPAMNADSSGAGILKFSAVSPAGVGGLATIAQLRFYAGFDTLPSPVTLSFSEMSAAGTFTDLLPILTVQGTNFCRSQGFWGDLDHDQAANSRDALIVLSTVVGLPVNPQVADTALADVDEDGRTTSRDALIILSFAVGMPIQGQRVLLPAVSPACATGSARQLAIQPGTIDLAVGQPMRLLAQATDSAGRSVSLPPMTWRSSDYTVAGVDASGLVTPRAAGTATITAEAGPGVTATATVIVITRRPNWFVDMTATGRPIQNGSATYPFEGPFQAFAASSEGDTIRIAPGTYAWNQDGFLSHGVVIQGGTPGDTTTRPVFYGSDNYIAFWLQGGQRTEVHNVVIQAFSEGFELDVIRDLVLEDVKLVQGRYSMDGIYACPNAGLDTLRIDRTEFIGNPLAQSQGDAIYVSGCTNLDVKTLVFRDSRIEHFYDALYLYGVDSLQVLRSVIRDNRGQGVYVSQEYNETPAVHVSQSRIERNRYGAIDVYSTRRIVIDSSVIRSDSSDVFALYHDGAARGHTYLRGDSVYMESPYSYWLETGSTDSLVLEDVVTRLPDDTAVTTYSNINADVVVFRRSSFLNLASDYYYQALQINSRQLLVDSVTATACVVCSSVYGFSFQGTGPQPVARVMRSSFSNIDYPIQAFGTGTVLEVNGVTADSMYTGVYASAVDSVAVLNSTFTRVATYGVFIGNATGARGPSLLAGNAITCVAQQAGQYGVQVTDAAVNVAFDTVTTCDRGVSLSSVHTGSRIRQSTLRSNNVAVDIAQGYPFDTVSIPVDSNGVSGTATAAVQVVGVVPFTHNRIENNAGDGLLISSTTGTVMQAHDNAFVSNAGYAVNVVGGDSVDATSNWWGSPSQPGGTPPNGVTGRVDTGSPLASAPANLPGLAPPALVQAARPTGAMATAPLPPVRAQPTGTPPESPAARLERDRQARLEAKAAKDARHAARLSR